MSKLGCFPCGEEDTIKAEHSRHACTEKKGEKMFWVGRGYSETQKEFLRHEAERKIYRWCVVGATTLGSSGISGRRMLARCSRSSPFPFSNDIFSRTKDCLCLFKNKKINAEAGVLEPVGYQHWVLVIRTFICTKAACRWLGIYS